MRNLLLEIGKIRSFLLYKTNPYKGVGTGFLCIKEVCVIEYIFHTYTTLFSFFALKLDLYAFVKNDNDMEET